MRMRDFAVGLAAVGLAATSAITGLEAGQTMTELDPACEIRASRVSGGVVLKAIAVSAKPISGTYDLSVRKDSPAGSSSTTQSGDFESVPGTTTILSEVAVSGGGKAKADLRLRWSGGETSCEWQARLYGSP